MFLELRTYRLKPGTGDDFVRVMRTESVPLLLKHGIDVVDCGLSLVREAGAEEAYLLRAFNSLEERAHLETSFYDSAAWRQGPREAIVSRIESDHTIVMEVADEALRRLRR